MLSKFLYNLNLEFENIFKKISEIVSRFNEEDFDIRSLIDTGFDEKDLSGSNLAEHKLFIVEKENAFEEISLRYNELKKSKDTIGVKHNIIRELIIQIQEFTEDIIKEIVEKETALNHIESDLFDPIKTFNSIFSEMLIYNVNSESDEIIQSISNATTGISTLLKDYKLINELKNDNVKIRNADFNIEDSLSEIIDKYSIIASFNNISLFHKIDRTFPTNLIGDKLILEDVLCCLLDISINYILISNSIAESNSMHRIDLSIGHIKNTNNKIIIEVLILNSGIQFKAQSKSSLRNLFYLYEKEFPFAEIKYDLVQRLLKISDSKLKIINENSKPALLCEFEYEVL